MLRDPSSLRLSVRPGSNVTKQKFYFQTGGKRVRRMRAPAEHVAGGEGSAVQF